MVSTAERHSKNSGASRLSLPLTSWCLLVCLTYAALFQCGCGLEPQEPMQICPGKGSVQEALDALRANAQKAGALGVNGKCLLSYLVDGKRKKEGPFSTTLRVDPPSHMYLQINVAFDARGIVAGANEHEFWLAIKPKEINTYWHGQWAEVRRSEGLLFNPRVMLEALGIADVGEGGEQNWLLMNEGPFDILLLHDTEGTLVKKVYVYCCDYVIRKIEYFDLYGMPEITAELGGYVQVTDEFSMPTRVTVLYRKDMDEAKFTLSTPKVMSFSEKQKKVLFNPPANTDRYENQRELVEGEWVDR